MWNIFLSEIFNGDSKLLEFVQRLLGYCTTGQVREHHYPILHGSGRNGKSTLIETIQAVLGDFTGLMPVETIMEQKNLSSAGGARADLMALRGKRLVWLSESPDGKKLNVSKMKALTGGDTITARPPFGKREINFQPTHKMLLLTNFKPRIPPEDFAAWQRVLLIPFTLAFVQEPKAKNERKADGELKSKMKSELPGILAWLVRGCLEWQRIGLQPPECVKAATAAYHSENDSVTRFIDECCEKKDMADVQAKVLFDAYTAWCDESGVFSLTINKFTDRMVTLFDRHERSRKQFYIGVRLKPI